MGGFEFEQWLERRVLCLLWALPGANYVHNGLQVAQVPCNAIVPTLEEVLVIYVMLT